ncbi:MAG: hypothetical protein GXP04_07595 [Alphaproteobacteria bacterium]|nr:hypothetical protein [Alphaproteobacteria bacterium]
MRFWNNEVYENPNEVPAAILYRMNELHDQKTG